MNKRILKAYVKIDGTGRVIAGSLVLRKEKPKVGKWMEIQGYQCCNNVTISTTIADPEIIVVGFRLICNGTTIGTYNTEDGSTTMEDLVTVLTNKYRFLGTFSAQDDVLSLTLSLDQKKALCPSGTLSFEIVDLD
jgi:hypothetical protein